LNKKDVDELRSYKIPPDLVVFVLDAVCILRDKKPDWDSAKSLLNEGTKFLDSLRN